MIGAVTKTSAFAYNALSNQLIVVHCPAPCGTLSTLTNFVLDATKPLDATLNAFTNYCFFDSSGGGSIGRSVQFGATNTVYEKRKGPCF